MNWLDVLIIIISVAFAFIGLQHGLLRAMFTVAGLIGGIYLAGQYYRSVAEQLFGSGSGAEIGAFGLILVAVVVVANLVSLLLQRLLSPLKISGVVDRGGGFVFGLGVGAIMCAAILTIITKYPFGGIEGTISHSSIAELLIDRLPLLLDLLPEEFDFLRDFFA